MDGTKKDWPLPKGKYDPIIKKSEAFRYEAEAVRISARAGQVENEDASHDDSLQVARIEDEIRRQIGVRYAADDE